MAYSPLPYPSALQKKSHIYLWVAKLLLPLLVLVSCFLFVIASTTWPAYLAVLRGTVDWEQTAPGTAEIHQATWPPYYMERRTGSQHRDGGVKDKERIEERKITEGEKRFEIQWKVGRTGGYSLGSSFGAVTGWRRRRCIWMGRCDGDQIDKQTMKGWMNRESTLKVQAAAY